MSKMKATARGRVFEDRSWNGVVSRIVAAYGLSTTASVRVTIAAELAKGNPVAVSDVRIEPVA